MSVNYVTHLPVATCKSVYESKLTRTLSQQARVEQFIQQHNLTDVLYVNGQDFMDPTKLHECIVYTLNDYRFVSLQKLEQLLNHLKNYTTKYFYLVINKFLVYTEHDNQLYSNVVDLDQRLVHHLADSIGSTLIESHGMSDDRGQVGNFAYPVTQLIFDVTN